MDKTREEYRTSAEKELSWQVKCKGSEQDKKRYKRETKVRMNGMIAVVDNQEEKGKEKDKAK